MWKHVRRTSDAIEEGALLGDREEYWLQRSRNQAVGTQLVIKCRYRNKSRYVPAIDPNPIKTLVIEMETHVANLTVYPDNNVFYECYPFTALLDFRTGELRVEQ